MKTLRSKIFIFVSLLLIVPALPLSYFTMQLLDKSYGIGVNSRVESALDGALNLSADYYRLQKDQLRAHIEILASNSEYSEKQIKEKLTRNFSNIEIKLTPLIGWQTNPLLIEPDLIHKFLDENKKSIIWPSADHSILFALAEMGQQILQIKYTLPEVFRNSAPQIQEINQIYKTLGLVRGNIRQSFFYTFLLIYGIGLMLALVISYFTSKRITKPIDSLKEATSQIGKGDLNYKINVTGKDEFAGLAYAFNSMTGELQANQDKIMQLEKMATWQQLARRLAHEIKNPLTPIQLMAQQMRDKYAGGDLQYKKMLDDCSEIIKEEVGSLKNLVQEFSDFARLPEFNPERQDILVLIDSVKKLYGQSNVEIISINEKVEVSFDYDHFRRVLINLVDNALAASSIDKPVRISLVSKETFCELSIADQGSGITSENINKIFEPYFSTKQSGVGLGLAIVKNIVEEHGGEISVESEVGKGTTFIIVLPFEIGQNE